MWTYVTVAILGTLTVLCTCMGILLWAVNLNIEERTRRTLSPNTNQVRERHSPPTREPLSPV